MEIADRILSTMKNVRAGAFTWDVPTVRNTLALFNSGIATTADKERILNMFVDFCAQLGVNGAKHAIPVDNHHIENELMQAIAGLWEVASTSANFAKLQILLFSAQRASKGLIRNTDALIESIAGNTSSSMLRVLNRIVFVYEQGSAHFDIMSLLHFFDEVESIGDPSAFCAMQGFVQTTAFNSIKTIRHRILYASTELLRGVAESSEMIERLANTNEYLFGLQLAFIRARLNSQSNNSLRLMIMQSLTEYIALSLLVMALRMTSHIKDIAEEIKDDDMELKQLLKHISYELLPIELFCSQFDALIDDESKAVLDIVSQLMATNNIYRKVSICKNLFLLNLINFADSCGEQSDKLKHLMLQMTIPLLASAVKEIPSREAEIDCSLLVTYVSSKYLQIQKADNDVQSVFKKVLLPKCMAFASQKECNILISTILKLMECSDVQHLLYSCATLLRANTDSLLLQSMIVKISSSSLNDINHHDHDIRTQLLYIEVIYLLKQQGYIGAYTVINSINTVDQTIKEQRESLEPIAYLLYKHNISLKRFGILISSENSVVTVHDAVRLMLIDLSRDISVFLHPIIDTNMDFNNFVKFFIAEHKTLNKNQNR